MTLRTLLLCSAALVTAPHAFGGGIDRSGQGLGALFQPGRYMELSTSKVKPNVQGLDIVGGATGDVVGDYPLTSFSVKMDWDEQLSFAMVADQPYGAHIWYGDQSTLLGGTSVDVSSHAILGLARYRWNDALSVHGGLRVQRSHSVVRLEGLAYGPVNGYAARFDEDTHTSPVLGVAYERSDIALRIAATYHDATKHRFSTEESAPLAPLNGTSTTTVRTPRAVNLDVQTGIAPGTLLFGQLRWVNWSEFRVDPERFFGVVGEGLIELQDTRTYMLGIARQFSDRWTGVVSLQYEGKGTVLSSPLSPINGRKGLTLAAVHTWDGVRITTGLSYLRLGDALLETGTPDVQRATMQDNEAVGLGLSVGWAW
ncbi:OmpP1/FadL family transporter [Candidatus Symbiobacter mobilis]|uniref:Long-chain fatty acid transport protein n=1 Tax=Candidatus Symbiobacter mobilis CR TaxID=946483 RepID=U5N9D6_9BURK|nr:Long-chain fatty acid transport protein [Candidatus Symbiobacter mobilis]AGX86838.1 long-chain fatty acid transport protein [Candidatus Symbiobacter mobilis CR]